MSKLKDTNSKLPDPSYLAGRSKPDYPFVFKEQDTNGKISVKYVNPAEPYTAFQLDMEHSGAYKSSEINQTYSGLTTVMSHENRVYTVGGDSKNTDGHKDDSVGATKNETVAGDVGHQIGGDHHHGVAGNVVGGGGGDKVDHTAAGHTYNITGGDSMHFHDGNEHKSIGGDEVKSITGNMHTTISEGDHGFHVQTGSMDIRVEAGQYQLYSGSNLVVNTASNMTITSPMQISITCGNSSIVMTPSSITIKATAINFVKA